MNSSKIQLEEMRKENSLVWDIIFIFLLYLEYPLMFGLILASLTRINLINVIYYILFVYYCIAPRSFTKHLLFLVIYSDLVVISRYVFSL